MRNFCILEILVLVFSGMCFGGETSAADHNGRQAEGTSAWKGILHPDGSGAPWSAGDRDQDGNQSRNPICYKMRSYLVRQTGRDTDEIEAVGYRTCLPGARVEMRSTEAPAMPAQR